MLSALRFCYISDYANPDLLLSAVKGGVLSVQYRDKNSSRSVRYVKARQLKKQLDCFNIPLIINDDVDLAHKINAAGVHLGQADQRPEAARNILGAGKIIGWSIESVAQLKEANRLSCLDYVAASAIFPSRSKADLKTLWGLEGLEKLVALSRHPLIAIGGIDMTNIAAIMSRAVFGAAVISAISNANDPERAARALHERIIGVKHDSNHQ
ncbi:bifunctional phosphomethylpyrimidine kinase ThiD/thiamin- phosphate pyrophosphorylase ThiE [Legionella birminghamensis]|uniref:Thiamine-phosphate synthase n=1 Tax=Legionella birminghamensis TaxID=28083 RepID=A0A378IC96_9GAMM|nr:thiamine phosphate synthase [Legionella birminghamensis]KTC72575.1 bifunctional phosphomethylpyrimidine kinase ThiD/thiamin- phosphate pyrophosphorylase ThiE [Legionella birminghamensis]STX32847.1 phosphomethylpyrimidine kinase ThiD/thiamin-phosphate pyrophosphorylase fused protein ThiE [Legionella birminghamensis]